LCALASAQTATTAPIPEIVPDDTFPHGPSNDHEIVVTAVGDVMLGTTFPDDSGGNLPPHDGADLL